MVPVRPMYSKSKVDKAGATIANDTDVFHHEPALLVLNNWRAAHNYPLNTFQATLRSKLREIDTSALVAQRLKRLPSILGKLKRLEGMRLSRMQDIGGLRAVVKGMEEVRALQANYESSRFEHELLNTRDYIKVPKDSGYRCLHLIYKNKNRAAPDWNGLCIELQIRTAWQHAWATAVETTGTLLQQALKSSEGPDEWLEFFALSSAALAHKEGTDIPARFAGQSENEILRRIQQEAEILQVFEKLSAFRNMVKIAMELPAADLFLLVLRPDQANRMNIDVTPFSDIEFEVAARKYEEVEKAQQTGDASQVVLVSADSLANLRKAYPNYFLDSHTFLYFLRGILDIPLERPR